MSELDVDVLEVDDISLPDSGIAEISADKFVSPSDELLTIADVMQHKLEIAHVLANWVQEPSTETSTNVNTAVECNLEERSLSQTFDMPGNLDNIVSWNVPEIGSQEVVGTENNNDENISVLFDVTDTEEISTQTMLCVEEVSTQTMFCAEEVSTQTLFCAGINSEYKLKVVKPTETCGTQAGLH